MTKTFLALAAAAVVLLSGCAKDSPEVQEARVGVSLAGGIHENFYVATSTLWPNPGAIPVCWEQSGFTQQKAWIRDAVHKAWEANDAAIKFTGWGQCTAGAPGIHIVSRFDQQDGPHVVDFGKNLDGVSEGMVLDLDIQDPFFANCHDSDAMFEQCNRGIAVHEFGHALGFLHEQERVDTPQSCPDRDPIPPESDSKTIGAWDLMSIMNYCYPNRSEVYPSDLSPLDKAGLVQMYPPPVVTPTTPPADTGAASQPAPQSSDPVETSGDDDDDDARSDDEKSSPSPSKKKKSSSSTHDADAPVASSGCSAAPNGSGSSSLGWIVALGLVVVARKRR